jgi:hypothetical protein
LTSINNHTKASVVPTIIVYFGDMPIMRDISTRVQGRLLQHSLTGLVHYTETGVVRQVLVDSAENQPVQKMVLPKFEEWLSPAALLKWSQQGMITGDGIHQLRIVVCVLDDQASKADIDLMYQRAMDMYRDRGVPKIEVVLYWLNDVATAVNSPYDAVVQINRKRVLNAESTIEHVVVASCTSALTDWIQQQKGQLATQHKNKKLQSIWVGCASIYVDVAQILKAFGDRVAAQFMHAWVSAPVDPRVQSDLQQEIRERVMRLRSRMLTNSLEVLASKGWNLLIKPDGMHVVQDTLTTTNASGLLKGDAEICNDIFGNATHWWTVNRRSKMNVFQRIAMIWHDFWQRDEFDLPTDQTVHAGLSRHLVDVDRSISKRLEEEIQTFHQDSNQYFASQLINARDYRDRTYGVKRLTESLRIFIREMELYEEIRVQRSRDGSEHVIPTINNVDDVLSEEVASLAVIHLHEVRDSLQRCKSRILSPYGILLRLFIISPVIFGIALSILSTVMSIMAIIGLTTVMLVVFGIVSFFVSMARYQAESNRMRSEFYEQSLTPAVLAITKQSLAKHQGQFLLHLRQLLHTYNEIDTMIDNSLSHPIPAVRDDQSPTRYTIREINRVFGTHDIVVDYGFMGSPWDELRDEKVRCYLVGQEHKLSWISQMKYLLNNKARRVYPNLPPKAEVMVMQQLADLVNVHHRQAHYALGFVQKSIRDEINSIIRQDPLALEELVDASKELAGGRKWTWLAQHARVDGAPRQIPLGMNVTKMECLLLSSAAQMMLGSITGSSNEYYQQVHQVLGTIVPYEMLRVEFEFDVV